MSDPTTAIRTASSAPTMSADEVSIDIAAPPKTVYDLVSNIAAMGKWSPETYKAAWKDGAHSAIVGAKFRGWNRRGKLRWFTDCEVVAADPGREFSFVVTMTAARWAFEITPTEQGCVLTQRRSQQESRLLSKITSRLMGPGRPEELRAGMIRTVERLKAAAEKIG